MKKLFALVALVGLGGFVAGCGDAPAPAPTKTPTGTATAPNMSGPAGGAPKANEGEKAKDGDAKDGDAKDGDAKDGATEAKDEPKDDAAPTEKKEE
jgi:hypothetical protein